MLQTRIIWPVVAVMFLAIFGTGCGPTRSEPPPESGDDDTTQAPNQPPEVTIVRPDDGDTVAADTPVPLVVEVSDVETAPDALDVTWESDQEGLLGQPHPDSEGEAWLNAKFSEPGEQHLTVTVTDEAGQTAQTALTLYIDGPPTAKISGADKRNPYEGEDVTFTGKVSDEEDDPQDLDATWTDGKGNFLGTSTPESDGTVTVTTDKLTAGSQTVILIATDSMGSEAQDTFKISVQRCVDQDRDGYTNCDGDCDDNDPTVNPGEPELCDGLDQDCDGVADNGLPDTDGNGIPDCRDQEICDGLDNDGDGIIDNGYDLDQDGVTTCMDDCDDTDPFVYPGADEVCDGKDTDCDGVGDDAFPDTDGDGTPDCVDVEECDGLDNDGDGIIDNGFDQDGDGFISCEDDCDDTDPTINVDAEETCDGVDENCDGNVDGEFPDTDGDGVPDCVDEEECDGIDNDGDGVIDNGFDEDHDYSTVCAGDCDDNDPAVHPGAIEFCDDIDNNCDGQINEGWGDIYEENDSLLEATDLGDQNGYLQPVTVTLTATIETPMDSDWYKISVLDDNTVPELFYVAATLTGIPEGANYDLYIWWQDPTVDGSVPYVVASSTNPYNQDEMAQHDGKAGPEDGGDYWIEVRWVAGFSCVQPYTLIIVNMG